MSDACRRQPRLCCECQLSRQEVGNLCLLPWHALINIYEFMTALTAFRRNVTFYANMTDGQLKNFYCQLVSYSAAKVVALNALVAKYNAMDGGHRTGDAYVTPNALSGVLSLALGGSAMPRCFIEKCLNALEWRSYEHMVVSCFAATEHVRSSVIRYTAIMRAHAEHCVPDGFRVLVATAVTGWMAALTARGCVCGTWRHVVHALSCFTEDTETSLTIQDTHRVGAYICELLDVIRRRQRVSNASTEIDYAYVFSGLIVPGLRVANEKNETLTTNWPSHSSTAQHSPTHDVDPPPKVGSRHK